MAADLNKPLPQSETPGLAPDVLEAARRIRASFKAGAPIASAEDTAKVVESLHEYRVATIARWQAEKQTEILKRENYQDWLAQKPNLEAQKQSASASADLAFRQACALIEKRPHLVEASLDDPQGPNGKRDAIGPFATTWLVGPFATTWLGCACALSTYTEDITMLCLPVVAGVIAPTQKVRVYRDEEGSPASLLEVIEHLDHMSTSKIQPQHVERMLEVMGIQESHLSRAMRRMARRIQVEADPLATLKAARAADAAQGIDINDDHRQRGLLPHLLRLAYFLDVPKTTAVMEWLIKEGADPYATATVNYKTCSYLDTLTKDATLSPDRLVRFVHLVPGVIDRTPGARDRLEAEISGAKGSFIPRATQLRRDLDAALIMVRSSAPAESPSTAPSTTPPPRRRRPGVF